MQLVLEYFSKGAEHGHTHVHDLHLSRGFPLLFLLSLSLHAFIESVPLNHGGHEHVDHLFWGVFLHKIPVAVALATIFKAAGYSSSKVWMYLCLFGLMAPLGLFFGELIQDQAGLFTNKLLAVAIGMLLHISTTIIFESSEGHKLNLYKLIAILVGFGAGALLA